MAHQQLVGGDQRERGPRGNHAARHRRLSNRDVAARLAALPATSSAHRREPAPAAAARVSQQCRGRRDDHPVRRQRCQRRHPPWLAMQLDEQMHMQLGDSPCDQRQQGHASDRRTPDPAIRPPRHRDAPRTSSPVTAGTYVTAVSPARRTPVRRVPDDSDALAEALRIAEGPPGTGLARRAFPVLSDPRGTPV